jgi:hypothetical protein
LSLLPRREDMFWADATAPDGFLLDGMRYDGQAVANGAKVAEGDKVLVARTTHGLTPGRRRGMVILQSSHGGTRRARSRAFFSMEPAITVGLWDQVWAAPYLHAASLSITVGLDNRSDCYEWSSHPEDPDNGLYLEPLGIVAGNSGKFWFVHRQFDPESEGFEFRGFRVALLGATTGEWVEFAALEIVFDSEDSANREVTSYDPNCAVFFDSAVNKLVVAPSQRNSQSGATTCSVWTVSVNEAGDTLSAVKSDVTVASGRTLRNLNNVGPYLFDAASLRGYRRNSSGLFGDLWTFDLDSFLGTVGMSGAVVVPRTSTTEGNYGAPWTGSAWLNLIGCYKSSTTLQTGAEQAKLLELHLAHQTGTSEYYDFEELNSIEIEDTGILKLNSVIEPASDAARDYIMPDHGTTSTETRGPGVTVSGEPTWDHTTYRVWLGAIYTPYETWIAAIRSSVTVGVNTTTTGRIPSAEAGDLADFGSGICVPLPSASPNTTGTHDRAWWSGTPVMRGSTLVTDLGWTFGAYLRGTPVVTPNAEGPTAAWQLSETEYPCYAAEYSDVPGTWYIEPLEKRIYGIYETGCRVNYQTVFYARSAASFEIKKLVLSQAWTGLNWGTADGPTITESLHVPENCWGAPVVCPEHELVFIFVDERSGSSADPIPVIKAINYKGESLEVKYTIPSSVLYTGALAFEDPDEAPFSLFEADQTYGEGTVWARAGQNKFAFHGWNNANLPEMKLLRKSGGETWLLVGVEAHRKVPPVDDTSGLIYWQLTAIQVGAEEYDTGTIKYKGGGNGAGIDYPSADNSGDKEYGPQMIRQLCLAADQAVYPSQEGVQCILRRFVD